MPDRITLITGNAGKAAEYAAMLGAEVTPAKTELARRSASPAPAPAAGQAGGVPPPPSQGSGTSRSSQ